MITLLIFGLLCFFCLPLILSLVEPKRVRYPHRVVDRDKLSEWVRPTILSQKQDHTTIIKPPVTVTQEETGEVVEVREANKLVISAEDDAFRK